jgi:hypothetical protein
METLKIIGSEDTPGVLLDTGNELFEISGRSLPEDVTAFYNPVLVWLDKYSENPLAKTVFNFKLTYFNTASSKMILDVMMKLESLHESGKEVLVKWFYPNDDEDMKEAGAEYADIVDIPFEQVGYNS